MKKSKTALSKKDLRERKTHWRLLMDILRYYNHDRSGSENYLPPLTENYFSCKEKLYYCYYQLAVCLRFYQYK